MGKTLVEHAEYELEKLELLHDEDPVNRKIATDTIALVKRFEKQKHTERSGQWVLDFVERICNFLPLSPVTDDPEEWTAYEDTHKDLETGKEVITQRWQNKRAPSLVSIDGGKTFVDLKSNKEGTSVDHIKQAEEWAKDRAEREAKKKAGDVVAQAPNVLARPPVDLSTPAGESSL